MIEQKVSEEQVRSLLVKGIQYGCFSNEGKFQILNYEDLVQRMVDKNTNWFKVEIERQSVYIDDAKWIDENAPLEKGNRKDMLLKYLHFCGEFSRED